MVPARAEPLPEFVEFEAPDAWGAIDFISDLHLSQALPRTFEAWRRHLLGTPADAVVILGDLFELWVGDDARHQGFAAQCAEVLAEAARRRTVALMVGNRDFLVGRELLDSCGVRALPDPTLLRAWGQRLLLTHGDALCLADVDYQAFRRQVRSAEWQAAFLARPLAARFEVARTLRRASAERRRFDGDPSLDIDKEEAARWLRAARASTLVHGHTHRPASDLVAPGLARHVLSDWDLDEPPPRAQVLRLTRASVERLGPVAA